MGDHGKAARISSKSGGKSVCRTPEDRRIQIKQTTSPTSPPQGLSGREDDTVALNRVCAFMLQCIT